ncbi:insulin growth factor-like family member 1, partial [Ochotona curzoniae]|uniref:insulin growth factor-like family member 1 n=1 Tax=Ochotona curzoniae TaxID=130825 RepID=UPI001B34D5BB
MAPCRCTLVTSATLYLLFMVLCPHRTTAPPTKGHLLLCQPYQKCGDKFFDPLQQCCHDDAVVPWNRTQGCGECIYKVCEEQCCAPHTLHNLLIVKPRGQDCQASIAPEDRLCPVRVMAEKEG